MRWISLTLLALCCAPAFAQVPDVGDLAPDLAVTRWLDTPQRGTLAEFAGEVVMLKAWGIDCGPCVKQLPHLNELHEKYGKKGLHIIGLYAQLHPVDQLQKFVKDHDIKFPQALNYDDDCYPSPSLPKVWIIGVTGLIIFVGSKDYEKVLEDELAKVKRPGLGKQSIASEVEPAAKAYLEGKYPEALKLAGAITEGDFPESVIADAEFVIDRITDRVATLRARAEAAEVQGEYLLMFVSLDELATAYKGVEGSEDAAERLAKAKADKKIIAELEANRAFTDLDRGLAFKDAGYDEWITELKKFMDKYKSTKAADHAKDALTNFELLLKEEKAAAGGTK